VPDEIGEVLLDRTEKGIGLTLLQAVYPHPPGDQGKYDVKMKCTWVRVEDATDAE
jgi:hypothetical protein